MDLTGPEEFDASQPLSTARWEKFAQNVASGMAGGPAYAAAGYDVDRGPSADMAASRLMRNDKVGARIIWLKAQIAAGAIEQGARDRSWVLSQLERNYRICMGDEDVTVRVRKKGDKIDPPTVVEQTLTMRDAPAANRALELYGKVLGIFDEAGDGIAKPEDMPKASTDNAVLTHLDRYRLKRAAKK